MQRGKPRLQHCELAVFLLGMITTPNYARRKPPTSAASPRSVLWTTSGAERFALSVVSQTTARNIIAWRPWTTARSREFRGVPKVASLAEARVKEEEKVVKDEDVAAAIRPLLRHQQKSTGDVRSRVDGARHVGSCQREWRVSTSTLLRNKLRLLRLVPPPPRRAPPLVDQLRRLRRLPERRARAPEKGRVSSAESSARNTQMVASVLASRRAQEAEVQLRLAGQRLPPAGLWVSHRRPRERLPERGETVA